MTSRAADSSLPTPGRRQLLSRLGQGACAALAPALLLPGCASMVGPQTIHLSETELALLLAHQCPRKQRVLEIIDLTIDHPELHLLPDTHRVSTAFDLLAVDRLFGAQAKARLSLDYALRYEPSDRSVRLKDVRVQSLALAGDASGLRGQAQRLGGLAAEHLLEGLTLWKMKPDQADTLDRLGFEARSVDVGERGVEIRIAPKAR